jgi:hypothetical protein
MNLMGRFWSQTEGQLPPVVPELVILHIDGGNALQEVVLPLYCIVVVQSLQALPSVRPGRVAG